MSEEAKITGSELEQPLTDEERAHLIRLLQAAREEAERKGQLMTDEEIDELIRDRR